MLQYAWFSRLDSLSVLQLQDIGDKHLITEVLSGGFKAGLMNSELIFTKCLLHDMKVLI